MKTRTALVSTLAAGFGLLACNKAADTLGPSEIQPTGTATLAARISAGATHEDSALLRKTQMVRATLDTGAPEANMIRLPLNEVDYKSGKVSFPSLRVGVSYVLKLEGLVKDRTLWSVTHSSILGPTGSSDNTPNLEVSASSISLKAPTYIVNGTIVTFQSNSDAGLEALRYWTRDTSGDWNEGPNVTLRKPDTLWAKDSILDVVGSAWTRLVIAADGSVKQDTLKAPTIALEDPTYNKTGMIGWAKLTLTENATGMGGTLQYSLDSSKWLDWSSDTTRLYGTGTVYARSYKNGAHSLISKQPYVVTPLTLPKPTVKVDSSGSMTTVTLTSNMSEDYPGSILYYSTTGGTNWAKYQNMLSYTTPQTILVKDSLLHQISTWDTIKVTIRNAVSVAAPTVSVASAYGAILRVKPLYGDQLGGLVAGANGIDTLKSISATCPNGLQIQYRPSSVALWTDGTPSNLTKTDSVYFRCKLDANSFSDSVPALFRILQRPALSIGDSSFYGSLTVKIANDTPSLLGQVTGEMYNYCIDTLGAAECQNKWVYNAQGSTELIIDTSANLWVQRQWVKGDSIWVSSPTVRRFTKASLASTGKLIFKTPAANLEEATRLYGIQSFNDDEGTTSKLSITSGNVLRFEATPTGSSKTPYAGFIIPLRHDYASFDFSNVTAITFDYKTSAGVTGFTITPQSLKYPNQNDGIMLQFLATLSETKNQASIGIPSALSFPGWADNVTVKSPNLSLQWNELKTSIQTLQFNVVVKAGEASFVEISNIQLILDSGKKFPLPPAQ